MKCTRRSFVATLFCVWTMYVAASDAGASDLVQLAKLKASNGAVEDFFGGRVAASGDTVAVGSSNRITFTGSVYVFVKPANGWHDMTETVELTPPAGTVLYGNVAISGDTLIAGATVNGAAAVCVFVKPATGWADATETAVLSPSDGFSGNGFANSLAISGDTVVVGAANFGDVGSVYIFVKPTDGWSSETETAKLTDGINSDGFGAAVGIDGETLVTGAPDTEVGFTFDAGLLDVFVQPPGGWTEMNPTAQLTAPVSLLLGDGPTFISGDTIVSGDIGRVFVFVKPAAGWRNTQRIAVLSDGIARDKDAFGTSASISANTVVVGAPEAKIGSRQLQGSAYTFQRPSTGWQSTSAFTQMLTAAHGRAGDWFGTAVAFAGDAIVIGAQSATVGGNLEQGAAYIFGH